jgi:adenosine kinase
MAKKYSGIVVIGSIGFDVIMNLPGKFTDFILPEKLTALNVSFTVNSLRREFGGTGGNCAYSLGLLGEKPRLMGVLGNDGPIYRKHLIDSGVRVDELATDSKLSSAVGHVMTDERGNQIWSYYPGPLKQLTEMRLQRTVQKNDLVALMPSTPEAFKRHLIEVIELGNDFMFDPSFFIPNLTKQQLEMGLNQAKIVIGNDYEVMLMEHKVGIKLAEWGKKRQVIVIKTIGEKGSLIYQGGKTYKIKAVPATQAIDPTGAGDAYRAGFLAGFIRGKQLVDCGQMGAVVATYCVEYMGTQKHRFTMKEFLQRLSREY